MAEQLNSFKEYTEETAKCLVGAVSEFLDGEDKSLHNSRRKPDRKKNGSFKVIITKEVVDRDGEVIKIDGIDTVNFMKNPVVLLAHNFRGLPIGIVETLSDEGSELIGEGVFASTDMAQEARILHEEGILIAVSMGFIIKEREGPIITRSELLEVSFVSVPSNPESLSVEKSERLQKFMEKFETTSSEDNDGKAAVPEHSTPKDPENMASNGSEAKKSLDKDEDREIDQKDIPKLKQALDLLRSVLQPMEEEQERVRLAAEKQRTINIQSMQKILEETIQCSKTIQQ